LRKVSNAEYLAFLSAKYEVDPDKLFDALNLAWEKKESKCQELLIQRRGRTKDKATFLFLKGSKVVAQFPVSKEFFLHPGNPLKHLMETDVIRRLRIKKNTSLHSFSIKDLKTGMKNVNLRAKVLEVPTSKNVLTRWGDYASVVNALIADETGTIRLCLWNEQIDSVSSGDTIQIENAQTSMYRGERQLSIGKRGTLSNVRDSFPNIEPVSIVLPTEE